MKMKVIVFFLGLMLFTTGNLFGQGTVVDDGFESAALGRTMAVDVYLPNGYDADDTETRYPVIYFLHGGSSSQNGYPEVITAMNNAIGNTIMPAIMVKPNGGPMNWWADSENTGLYETYVVEDLIAYIDQTYNTDARAEKRSIMGHSLGGYGTMAITMRHPDLFCAAASHGGALHFPTNFIGAFQQAVSENGGSGPYDPNAGWWSGYLYNNASVFSPNMDNPPYYCDLPIDNDGELIEEVWARWLDDDPGYLASQVDNRLVPPLYMDAGTSDFSYTCTNEFTAKLDTLGIGYCYISYPGGHMNQLPQRYPFSLAFLDSVMNQELPRAYNGKASPSFIYPEEDSTIVSAFVTNSLDHELNVSASIRCVQHSAVEVITLYDDGLHGDGEAADQVWANYYNPSWEEEDYFTADILVEDVTNSSEIWSWDAARFTTVGPVTFYELRDTTGCAVPGQRYNMKVVLLNESETDTIHEVKAQLIWDESMMEIAAVPKPNYGEMYPGEPDEHSGLVRFDIADTVIPGSGLTIQLIIESDEIVYWEDSFTIPVAASGVNDVNQDLPSAFSLSKVYPNPFNPSMNAEVLLPENSHLQVKVYNIAGQEVGELANDFFSAGKYTFQFNAGNLASGVYFLSAEVPRHFSEKRKIVLMK